MHGHNGQTGWFTFGSVVGLLKYYWSTNFHSEFIQVNGTTAIEWWSVYAHVTEAVIVAMFAGGAGIVGKEAMKYIVRKIKYLNRKK